MDEIPQSYKGIKEYFDGEETYLISVFKVIKNLSNEELFQLLNFGRHYVSYSQILFLYAYGMDELNYPQYVITPEKEEFSKNSIKNMTKKQLIGTILHRAILDDNYAESLLKKITKDISIDAATLANLRYVLKSKNIHGRLSSIRYLRKVI